MTGILPFKTYWTGYYTKAQIVSAIRTFGFPDFKDSDLPAKGREFWIVNPVGSDVPMLAIYKTAFKGTYGGLLWALDFRRQTTPRIIPTDAWEPPITPSKPNWAPRPAFNF